MGIPSEVGSAPPQDAVAKDPIRGLPRAITSEQVIDTILVTREMLSYLVRTESPEIWASWVSGNTNHPMAQLLSHGVSRKDRKAHGETGS